MNLRLRRPSPALVISCIALFVSLGGVSYGFATGSIDGREIKNGTITTKDIRNNEVRGADIRNSTIGGRDVAFDTLGGNDIKESTLRKVPDADNLDGVDSSAFVRREAPAFAPIPHGGEVSGTPEYDVDGSGYVHLQGSATPGNGAFGFLPPGARPAKSSRFAVPSGSGIATLTIDANGEMIASSGPSVPVYLDGVTFAAGG